MPSPRQPLVFLTVGVAAGVLCAEAARAATPVVGGAVALLVLGFGAWACRRPQLARGEGSPRHRRETGREFPGARETVHDLAVVGCEPNPGATHTEAAALLARSVAHDLNNLLAVVNGCGFQLEPVVGCDPIAGEHLRTIESVTAEAAHAIRRLDAVSRPAGARAGRTRAVPVSLLVSRLLTNRRALFGSDIACVTNLVAGVRVRIDEGQFELAILSLILGARDAMSGGQISLTTRRTGSEPGKGEWVDLAVEFFPRGPAGDADGVALVRGVVARSGGSVSVEPRTGSGVRVAIRLRVESECAEERAPLVAEERSDA